MLLVIDVGNTNIVMGLYENGILQATWRMSTRDEKTSDETGIAIYSFFKGENKNIKDTTGVIIGSVVPNIMYSLIHGIKKYIGIDPIVVTADMPLGIKIIRDNPRECGVDRVVNVIAAKEKYGTPAIVIDYGTANTFDVINEKSEFVTGFITAGIKICADELYKKAAQIPKVELISPETLIAKTTVDSLQAGIVASKIGETIEIINTLKRELNIPDAKVIATGGLANIIDPDCDIFDVYDPVLTLDGLKIIYEEYFKDR
jgi:type III pantothenate kinase